LNLANKDLKESFYKLAQYYKGLPNPPVAPEIDATAQISLTRNSATAPSLKDHISISVLGESFELYYNSEFLDKNFSEMCTSRNPKHVYDVATALHIHDVDYKCLYEEAMADYLVARK